MVEENLSGNYELDEMTDEAKASSIRLCSLLISYLSGADISVLPKSYGNVGQWAPGTESLKMVDAHKKQIAHDGVTRARLRTRDANGKNVEMVEEFVLGNVKHPILCAGRLLRKGWCIENEGGSLTLQHEERSVVVPISDERNSLQFAAKIHMVETMKKEEKQQDDYSGGERTCSGTGAQRIT